MDASNSIELQMLFCAIALGIVQLLIAVLASVGGRGMSWAIGPRDDAGASQRHISSDDLRVTELRRGGDKKVTRSRTNCL